MNETLTLPMVSSESGSQGRPMLEGLGVRGMSLGSLRRLPSFRPRFPGRKRRTLPTSQGISESPVRLEGANLDSEDTMVRRQSHTKANITNYSPQPPHSSQIRPVDEPGNERWHPPSAPSWGWQVANQPAEESADKNVTILDSVDRHEPVASTSYCDTAGGDGKRTDARMVAPKECESYAISKAHVPMPDANSGEKRPNILRRLRTKLQKTGTSRSKTLPSFRRKDPQPPFPGDVRSEESDLHGTTLRPGGGQPKPTDTKDPKRTEGESEEVEELRRDLSESRSKVAELQKRCEAQSRDLESSNGFLNATDKSSDSDVIHALQKLNAEVQQSTTYMADCLAESFEFEHLPTNPTKEQASAVQRASETIGQVLANSLGARPPEDITMLLQIAFQAYLTSALAQAASSWVFEPSHNKFINAIYQSLRGVEAQAVSGRWRTLARFHIVHSWVSHPEDLVKGIIAGFSDILLAAGCTALQSDIASKITSEFEQKLSLLVELAVRLNKLFDEIISSDFEVLVVRPGEKFESKNMEDTDGDEAVVQDASVLCATHLGLIKRMPVGTLWEKGRKQKLMVLKAKVLLESFLNMEDG